MCLNRIRASLASSRLHSAAPGDSPPGVGQGALGRGDRLTFRRRELGSRLAAPSRPSRGRPGPRAARRESPPVSRRPARARPSTLAAEVPLGAGSRSVAHAGGTGRAGKAKAVRVERDQPEEVVVGARGGAAGGGLL